MLVRDNRALYPQSQFDRTKQRLAFEMFPVEVVSVDYERKALTVQDPRDNIVYTEVTIFPAHYSSTEGIDVTMPEIGAMGLAVPFSYESGFKVVMVAAWLQSQTVSGVDAIARRPIEGTDEIRGWTTRRRSTYRKAYPGQRTSSMPQGYSERQDSGWDRQGADLSRDKLDSDRRQWTQIAGRRVTYTDAGISILGSVNRPDAAALKASLLPDGSSEFIAYLQPAASPADRYVSGKQDVIPFAESTELVQEYALDYPVPAEVLQTDLLDSILGTVADPWARTSVTSPSGTPAFDNETFMAVQSWDHPDISAKQAIGPALKEGATPQRRAFIIEKSHGTLVGHNRFDKSTYGLVLKPVVFPAVAAGRFGADVESGYMSVRDSVDHAEARLAASCMSVRFPYEYNTTRIDVTKEGFTSLEIGSTLPKENIPLAGGYEHPHGAGRSLEAHFVGSIKAVIGKNRDEEDAIDVQALGQAVIRLGADDTSLPNARRGVLTQNRALGDAVTPRSLQYWKQPKLSPGDAGDLENKTGAESVSLRAALDGAAVIRLGARNVASKRRHLVNGYQDGPGKTPYAVGDSSRVDSHSSGRPTYGAGDNIYAFHDLTRAGAPQISRLPYNWSGQPIDDADAHGLSLDLHAVRDILVRVGKNPTSGQSIVLDTDGGLVVALGKDAQGRSVTGTFDGGIEVVIRPNQQGKAIRLEIDGDIDITHKGNLHWHSTGDWVTEQTTWRNVTKTDRVFTQQKSITASLARDTTEAPDIVHNQGLYESDENS
jgi:hypothetical protein